MLAAVLKEVDGLVLEDVPIPEPGLGKVVVRIKSCGFCATDYKAIKGIRRNVAFPLNSPLSCVKSTTQWTPWESKELE